MKIAYLNDSKWFPKSQGITIGIFLLVVISSMFLVYFAMYQFLNSNKFEVLWIAGVGFIFCYIAIKWFELWYKHYKAYKKKQSDYNEAEEIKAETKSKKGISIIWIVLVILAIIRLLYSLLN